MENSKAVNRSSMEIALEADADEERARGGRDAEESLPQEHASRVDAAAAGAVPEIGREPDRMACPECLGTHLTSDAVRGELFCDGCGFVVEDKLLDYGPEYSSVDGNDGARQSRTGPPQRKGTLNSQLNTVIGMGILDSNGSPISQKSIAMYCRLRRLQRHSSRSRRGERSVGTVSNALSRMASQLEIPPAVADEASYISMQVIKSGLLRGRSVQALVSAAIYISCRNAGVPRTLKEVLAVAEVDRGRLTKMMRTISRQLGMRPKPIAATDYVARFCSELSLGDDVRALAGRMLSNAPDENSLTPPGKAAASIYLAALARGQRIPQKRIAKVSGVSEVTLRSHFRLFENLVAVTIPRGRCLTRQARKRGRRIGLDPRSIT